MNLKVNVPLEEALDNGWKTLAECFTPDETGFRTELVKEFWPKGEGETERKSEGETEKQDDGVGKEQKKETPKKKEKKTTKKEKK
jgi:hypothetical protein